MSREEAVPKNQVLPFDVWRKVYAHNLALLRASCSDCNGAGGYQCPVCLGEPREPCKECNGQGHLSLPDDPRAMCSECGGQGVSECEVCEGNGSIRCPNCDPGAVYQRQIHTGVAFPAGEEAAS